MPINISKFILSIGICLGAGILGSVFTTSSIPTWYATLNKPSFSPPNFVFAPVWTTLYILMGISLYLVISEKGKREKGKAVQIFAVQLILNVLWSIIFFGLKNPILALVDVVTLLLAIFLTIKAFQRISQTAAYLLYPYLAWVTFALFLNLSIVFLNP